MFPPRIKRKDLDQFLMVLMRKFFFRWSGAKGFRLLTRMIRVKRKKEVWLDIAVEMDGFSDDHIKECWTDEIGLKEGVGYNFLKLDDDDELRLADWETPILRSTPVVEYGGIGSEHSVA